MIIRGLFIFIMILGISSIDLMAYSQQKMKDFYLSNYKEDGSSDWEVKGQEAVLADRYVDIDKMTAKYYPADNEVKITSNKAKLDKESMNVHLQDEVKVATGDGITMTTESLDWQRGDNTVTTNDRVKASKDSMQIEADGMTADTKLKKIGFDKNVEVKMPDKTGSQDYVTINCIGPLEVDYNSGTAVFNQKVVVEYKLGKLFADKATVYFDPKNKQMIKIVAEINVKILKEDNVTFADKATYINAQQRLVLEGNPRVIYFPKDDEGLDFNKQF